ncbi:diphthine synthase [Candidatus Woesearchaeota archaeon]|nr:diphthine synthase [Candidatus Woesearchaeota archaeon]
MSLYFIGLGLGNENDISVKGLELVKKSDVVYLENYTSQLNCSKKELEKLYGKEVILADRKKVEIDSDEILDNAQIKNVAFLVVGDVFSATTHLDLYLRAKEKEIKIEIVNNASVLTAIGITGLQLYKFGKTSSIPFENENVQVPYDVLKSNLKNNLHTLFLLDLNPVENKILSVNDAIRYLQKVELKRGEGVFKDGTLCVGCSNLGSQDRIIKSGKAHELLKQDFGKGMQCLIVPSQKLHFMEEEALRLWR